MIQKTFSQPLLQLTEKGDGQEQLHPGASGNSRFKNLQNSKDESVTSRN